MYFAYTEKNRNFAFSGSLKPFFLLKLHCKHMPKRSCSTDSIMLRKKLCQWDSERCQKHLDKKFHGKKLSLFLFGGKVPDINPHERKMKNVFCYVTGCFAQNRFECSRRFVDLPHIPPSPMPHWTPLLLPCGIHF